MSERFALLEDVDDLPFMEKLDRSPANDVEILGGRAFLAEDLGTRREVLDLGRPCERRESLGVESRERMMPLEEVGYLAECRVSLGHGLNDMAPALLLVDRRKTQS